MRCTAALASLWQTRGRRSKRRERRNLRAVARVCATWWQTSQPSHLRQTAAVADIPADCEGGAASPGKHPENAVSREELIDNVMFYWLTATGASSARLYWESFNRAFGQGEAQRCRCRPDAHFPQGNRAHAAQLGRTALRQHRLLERIEKGGHFAAFEQPEIFADGLRSAFERCGRRRDSRSFAVGATYQVKKKRRYGFIGAGGIAGAHLRELARRDDVELVAMADISEAAMQRHGENFGIGDKPSDRVESMWKGWDHTTYTVEDLAVGRIRFAQRRRRPRRGRLRFPRRRHLELRTHGRPKTAPAGTRRKSIATNKATW